jgi:squalene-hopene/tetraprenyl-beta-curcumene cyclase
LLRLQHEEGYWCGELFVDSTLCSDYVLFMHWADELDPVLQEKCVAHIRGASSRRRLEHLRGRPSEVSASVKAYLR